MPYSFLDHTADILYEVKAKTLEELFSDSAKALTDTQVDINKIEKKEKYNVVLENKRIDALLFDWLNELIFIKDSKQLIFSDFSIQIKKNDKYKLKVTCYGEKIKLKHEQKADAKAITMHKFRVWYENGFWNALVLVDV